MGTVRGGSGRVTALIHAYFGPVKHAHGAGASSFVMIKGAARVFTATISEAAELLTTSADGWKHWWDVSFYQINS